MSNENDETKNGGKKMTNKKSAEELVRDYLDQESIIQLLNDSLPDADKKGIYSYTAKLVVTLAHRLQETLYCHVSALYLLKSNEEQRAVKMAFAYEAVRLARLIAYSLVDTFEHHVAEDRPFKTLSEDNISIFL